MNPPPILSASLQKDPLDLSAFLFFSPSNTLQTAPGTTFLVHRQEKGGLCSRLRVGQARVTRDHIFSLSYTHPELCPKAIKFSARRGEGGEDFSGRVKCQSLAALQPALLQVPAA